MVLLWDFAPSPQLASGNLRCATKAAQARIAAVDLSFAAGTQAAAGTLGFLEAPTEASMKGLKVHAFSSKVLMCVLMCVNVC